MAAPKLEWVLIHKFGTDPIGAIGFLGDEAATVIAFFDDRDGDQDGTVSIGEKVVSALSPISLEGRSVTEVAMQARINMEILKRDASFAEMAGQLYVNFAQGLVLDGLYATYFGRGINMTSKGVAKLVTSDKVKGLIVRKGFEKGVTAAFKASTAY